MRRSLLPLLALTLLGCERREAMDPSEILADEKARVAVPPPRSLSREHVTCRCDAEGGLHVVAPQGSKVFTTEREGEADIVLPDEAAGQPIRRTKSLGFIGDNKLSNDGPRAAYAGGGYSFPSYFGSGYGYRPSSSSHYGPRRGYGPR